MIHSDFPTVGSALKQPPPSKQQRGSTVQQQTINVVRALDSGCCTGNGNGNACACPQRTAVPKRPSALPIPCHAENIDKMKKWMLDHFASSTFNTCPHRPLPCMAGPPIEIHINDGAPPRACHTAASIPVHWQDQVRQDLLRDEKLGVIERVPYGEPVTWCHRMVVTRKHDGTPRRTVDLSPLNKHCHRETHSC